MCLETAFPPVEVCLLDNLVPGQRFYDPSQGSTLMLVELPRWSLKAKVVNLRTGVIGEASTDLRLARNGHGCLYASRTLNAPAPTPDDGADTSLAPDLGGEG